MRRRFDGECEESLTNGAAMSARSISREGSGAKALFSKAFRRFLEPTKDVQIHIRDVRFQGEGFLGGRIVAITSEEIRRILDQ
jgi:hypothetical protein